MFNWLRTVYYAIVYRDVDKAALVELLEIAMKSGRRCAYDLNHAAGIISLYGDDTTHYSRAFHSRADHYKTMFNSAQDMKNYRINLHKDIDKLERRVETLERCINEYNAQTTGEKVHLYGPDDIPF